MSPAAPRCQHLARFCTDEPERVVRLAEVRDPVALCEPCIDFAKSVGMDPRPVPTWLARGVTGENGMKDLTGAATVRSAA